MRLLTRSTLISSLLLLLALIVSGFYIYKQVSQEVKDEIDEELLNRKLEIVASIKAGANPIVPQPAMSTDFRIEPISPADYAALTEHFEDIDLYELIEGEHEPHRQLVTKFHHDGKPYALRIQTSLLDLEDMGEIIALSTFWVIIGLITASFLLNFLLQRQLWQPFYTTLEKLREFRLDQSEPLQLPSSSVQEFTELTTTVTKLTAVNQRAYQLQKQFVENASHEIQTPLAISLHQTEQLIQNPDLNAADANALGLLTQQLERLSAMNKALLLISKIDNQQYGETQAVRVDELVRKQAEEYGFMAEQKNLRVSVSIENELVVDANEYLIEILVRNLIRNAMLHSVEEGTVEIQLAGRTLRVQNTAVAVDGRPDALFGRFVKQSDKQQSLGLGLAIVKSICDNYHFTPTIEVPPNLFSISVQF